MKKYVINVTQRDIDCGKRGCHNNCAIAKALIRKFKNRVSVSSWCFIVVYKGFHSRYFRTNDTKVRKFIADFDAGRPVFPMSFTLVE